MREENAGVLMSVFTTTVMVPLVWWLTKSAARGELERNGAAGIRTKATRGSDAAWLAGHQAALRPMGWTLVAVLVMNVIVVGLAVTGSSWATSLSVLPALVLVLGLIPSVRAANRAADQAG